MSEYELRLRGVLHRASSTVIQREDLGWAEYESWLQAGGIPDPMPIPPIEPQPPPTQQELDSVAARAYAKLTALRTMTPAQVITWVDANVTNLESAKDAIKTLAIAVSILSRRI